MREIFITIVGIQNYKGRFPFSAGRQLIGAKEPDNIFDKKAIKILDVGNTKVGYVANKPNTALEDTMRADEVYDLIGDYCVVEVVCSTDFNVVCSVVEPDFKKKKLIAAFTTDRYDANYPFTDIYPPKGVYPFGYDEFPFEYNLSNIDITEETIPEEWCKYLLCWDLNIDYTQFKDIAAELGGLDAYSDVFYLLGDIKEKENIKEYLIEQMNSYYIFDSENEFNKMKIPQIAGKIAKILARPSKGPDGDCKVQIVKTKNHFKDNMRLRLDIDGIVFYLKITGYREISKNNWDDAWCDVEACLQNEYLNYNFGSEILLCAEIDTLEKYLYDLLSGKMTERKIMECIEPDFEFICEPPNINNGYQDDILLVVVINLWEQGYMTANSIHLTLDKTDIEQLYTYLLYVKGVINKTDERIIDLISQKILLPTYMERR